MKVRYLVIVAAAVLVVGGLAATKALAAEASGAASARGKFLQRIANKLDLTSDQRTQLMAILAGEKDTVKTSLTGLHDAKVDLRAAIRASDASEASVRAASAKVAAAEADLAVEQMKLYGKIAPVLTDTQRQQLTGLQQHADEFIDRVLARFGSGPGE